MARKDFSRTGQARGTAGSEPMEAREIRERDCRDRHPDFCEVMSFSSPSPDAGPQLRDWLAAEGGAAPFRKFMEAALYDPVFGYYSKRIRTVGRDGDFSTSATLSPVLARAVAGWVNAEAAAGPGIRDLIEIGPGSGALHRELRRALGWRGRWHWRSHLVERSPGLREVQRRTVGVGGRVRWHEEPGSALAAAGGRALIFSNELVDAFPVRVFQKHAGVWQEVWLELTDGGKVVETVRELSEGDEGPGLSLTDYPDGQRVETQEAWRDWLRGWREEWKAGAMLTVDYGDRAGRLYHRRPQGTLRGYQGHRRLDGTEIYRNLGTCDLTADVNFSDLIRRGEALGLAFRSLESQLEFLRRFVRAESGVAERLMDPAGAGGAFLCLVQDCGVWPGRQDSVEEQKLV